MSTQTQTLMEKLVTEIDTKNSWGKNQLVETTIKIYRGINVSDNEFESQIIQIENNETFENTIDNVAKTEAKENPFN